MATQWLGQTTDGWIVTLDSAGRRRSLPSHIKLNVTGTTSGRDQFQVLEGVNSGTDGTIATGSGLLTTVNPHKSAATVRFRNRTGGPTTIAGVTYDKELVIEYNDGSGSQSAGPFNAVGDSANPIPVGSHVLQVPDYPHDLGASYSQYGTVWFRIGTSGDRYLHPGSISAGCATAQGSTWVQIYETIVKRRDASNNVGTLITT